ncbi:MAG: hypothetical protein U5O69_04980 [Candidatus Competibacteraceae bacterium]|nr:hypothetical protein [Candidatus Competibacteraceae bacterium]
MDVLSVPEANKLGASDREHRIAPEGQCLSAQRGLRPSAGVSHAGIVDAHQRASVGEMIRGWMLIYQALDSEDMTGQVEYL